MKHEYKAPIIYVLSFVFVILLAIIPSPVIETGRLLVLIWTIPWSLVYQFIVLFMIHEGYGAETRLTLALVAAMLNAGILFYWGKSKRSDRGRV